MQPWHRWREPLAVVLLIALALMLGVRVVSLDISWQAGDTSGLRDLGGDSLLLLAAAAAVLWCATPTLPAAGSADPGAGPTRSPHARPIAVAGCVVVGSWVLLAIAVASWNVLRIIQPTAPPMGSVLIVIEGVLRLVVPGAALVAVVLATRRTAGAGGVTPPMPTKPALEGAEGADGPVATPPPERLPAAWQADEATGAVWLTADDAAQGRPGLSWSDPAASTDPAGAWSPPPQDATPAEPSAAEDDDLR